ncbi:MAG: hypothetical protein LBD41_02775, partial [Clostridiales Family XIII bacterium]|nr:hypothetical protein [Clostridiales Family XIII bacterium]
YDSELADAFLNVSRKPILYTEYEGIYSFDKSELSGDTLTYDTKSTQYTLNGVIASLLSEGNKIKIRSHNSVDIMNGSRHIAHLESPKMGMLLFG